MAANPTIQLKRKTTSGAPATLSIGEPAVNTADNQLYIGVNSSGIKWIGAEIENSATNGTTWSSDLKLATKKAIGDYFAAKSGTTFTGDITLSGGSDIRFVETGGGTDYVAIQAPSVVSTGNVTLTLPGSYAAADGYVLSSTTGGTLSWISAGTASSVSVTETSTNSAFNLLFTSATSTTSASLFIDTDDKITFNPSTNNLTLGGSLEVSGGALTTTFTGTATLFNSNATALEVGKAASTVSLGAISSTVSVNNLSASGDIAVNGGDITTTVTGSSSIFDTNTTDLSMGRAATTITLGASTSTISLRGGTLIGNATIQNLFNTTATTLNIGGSSTSVSIGAATGTTTINNANTVVTGDLAVNGADITTTSTGTATVFNATATTVNVGGAATAMTLGDATSSTITLRGGTLVGNTATQNVFDTTATTVNAFGAATICTIGHDGTSNSTTNIATGTTAALGAKTVNIATNGNASATVNVNIGTTGTGTCQINSPSTDIQGDLTVRGGDIISNQTSFNLLNSTVTSLSIGGASTSVSIGAATGTTTINNANTVVTGDLAVNGGDITTTTTGTANIFNTNASAVYVGGAAADVILGSTSSTVTVNGTALDSTTTGTFTIAGTNPSQVDIGSNASSVRLGAIGGTVLTYGDLTVGGGDITTTLTTASVFNSNVTTLNIGQAATQLTMSATSGTTTIRNDLTVKGVILASSSTGEIFNSGSSIVKLGEAATSISIGSTSGTTTINSANTVVTGDLAVNGADITTTSTGTATLFNSNATTVNIGGAATTMTLGASTATINLGGGTTGATVVIKGNLQVDGSTTTINSTTLTVDDKLIELAHSPSGAVGNDAAVDGGGIQLNSSQGNKTFTWVDSTDAWTSSEHLNLASGKAYYINGTSVLNATTLGSTVTGSSLTQVGTVTLGTWNGTTIGVGYGGTGLTTYTTGQILYASAASTLAGLTASSTAGAVVSSTGAGTAPEYKTISVTNGTVTPGSGTLTLAIQDASADGSTKGLATFNATQFDSASGVITLDTIDGGTYA